jgi:hypothetical protein
MAVPKIYTFLGHNQGPRSMVHREVLRSQKNVWRPQLHVAACISLLNHDRREERLELAKSTYFLLYLATRSFQAACAAISVYCTLPPC